jgi:hypothetical protein
LLLLGQMEIYRDIADSKRDLEDEKKSRQKVYDREKGHLGSLDALGLNELEAVEYVMMLSRDEEESRRLRKDPSVTAVEDELFQGDFDVTSGNGSGTSLPQPSNVWPRQEQLLQSSKVEIVEREPMTIASNSRRLERTSSLQSIGSSIVAGDDSFPAISSSVPAMSHTRPGSIDKASVSGSPTSVKSAWSVPMNRPPSFPRSSVYPSEVSRVIAQELRREHMPRPLCGASEISGGGKIETQEDRDIRYAIELSLAEARSLGGGDA